MGIIWAAIPLCVALLAPATASADATILVMDLRPIGVSEEEAATITTVMAELLAERSELRVVTVADVSAMLDHQVSLQMLGCADESCITQLSKAANAKLALSGSVGRIGNELVINLTLLDTKKARPAGSASRSVKSIDDVLGSVPGLLAEVFGWPEEGAAPKVRFRLPEGRQISFAVFDLKPQGLSQETAGNLTQVLAGELKQIEGASVIGRDDVASLLELESEKARMDCATEMDCLAEIGGALGVDKLVVGTAGKLGESYLISLRLIDVNAGRVDSRVNESLKGLEDQLIPAVRFAGRRLLGLEQRDQPGTLYLTGSEKAAKVYLDDEELGQLPLKPIAALAAGRHSLRISKDGYFDWRTDFYVEPGGMTPLWAELIEEPLRWYQRWWVWTIVGVAAAAGAGLGVGFYIDGATKFPQIQGGAHPL